ncbi:hypothetical protein MAR_009198 [Mya arenaria]|uniref:C3H1-type domain-containing protein n=1 Tax=Mya arenaria TaxID=6604 RepID=A0ABY7DYR1_MYAAR|nr:uncharacterized protein LOC128231401 [Mya arenaria]WAR02640.1 hypothetical protein MAR_009198 [Mya arenaria]
MSSLVADYSSDSDSIETGGQTADKTNVQSVSEVPVQSSGQNYLISQDEDDSSDSDVDKKEKSYNTPKEKLPNPLLEEKLPTPQLGGSVEESREGSVFNNKYDTAAKAKQSVLEKHVKMTEAQILTGKKAKICKKFKQGRCFYGKNCQFSHDLDANLSLRYKQDETIPPEDVPGRANQHGRLKHHKNPHAPRLPPPPVQKPGFMGTMNTLNTTPTPIHSRHQMTQFRQQERSMQSADREGEDDDKFNVGDKRKKRVGVSQTLVPPKRAMSALAKQRQEERPWTMKK